MSITNGQTVPITEQQVSRALEPGRSLEEAVSILLDSFDHLKTGGSVAILDGSAYGIDGIRGTIKGPTNGKSGFVDVQLPNKMIVPIQANLLLPV